jgi:hypothetical protein
VLIGGFIVAGTTFKPVLIRGLGPSLASQGIQGVLADPFLQLFDFNGNLIAQNNNWKDTQQATIEATGIPPTSDLESAIVTSLAPSSYTAILSGANAGTGIGLIEIYDLDTTVDARLPNISTRGFVGTGENVLIGGFIVGNGGNATVLLAAIGPSLSILGISDALQDPTLELHDANGVLLAFNNNWMDSQQAQIQATGLAPTDNRESVILTTLVPGDYTVIVRGLSGTSGVALFEAFNIQ